MAGQRRGERRDDPRGGRGGLGARLRLTPLFLCTSIFFFSCEGGSPFEPGTVPPADDPNPGTLGGGGNAAQRILGTWMAELITFLADNDFITSRTTWEFRNDGSCRQVVSTRQFSEGVTYLDVTDCSYTLRQGLIEVTEAGAMAPVVYTIAFPIADLNSLVLSDIVYHRVP